jgi:hypothetical protein
MFLFDGECFCSAPVSHMALLILVTKHSNLPNEHVFLLQNKSTSTSTINTFYVKLEKY